MKISLLIPCYNASNYLDKLKANIEKLSDSFDEVLLYDDRSEDNTVEKAKELGFEIIEGKINKGPSYARNQLAKIATGDWIHFHDADDEIAENYLAVNRAFASKDYNIILCDSDWINEGDRKIQIARKYPNHSFIENSVVASIKYPIGVLSGLIEKSAFLKVGGFREDIHCWEDSDLFVRMAGNGAKFISTEQVLVYSIRHQRGISKDQTYCRKCRFKILKDYLKQYGDNIEVKETIFQAFQKLAEGYLKESKRTNFLEVLDYANQHGGNLPLSSNSIVNMIKKIGVSPSLLFRIQYKARS